ncbi:hypothetical protein RFI_20316 [Reticulomyxa filosa]|uniref:Uncharacterized protein n=1 Tax=Reticulomyxa filosa TaxID=46433 RepID=X6MTP0_RETFI|nr:hypothetical protein RFI_20316 [Reticulomyxa filosa]|eukprot:ETO17021.1 hypothetical protein RFI_20316 [Reticulomyxa filosa]
MDLDKNKENSDPNCYKQTPFKTYLGENLSRQTEVSNGTSDWTKTNEVTTEIKFQLQSDSSKQRQQSMSTPALTSTQIQWRREGNEQSKESTARTDKGILLTEQKSRERWRMSNTSSGSGSDSDSDNNNSNNNRLKSETKLSIMTPQTMKYGESRLCAEEMGIDSNGKWLPGFEKVEDKHLSFTSDSEFAIFNRQLSSDTPLERVFKKRKKKKNIYIYIFFFFFFYKNKMTYQK